MYKIVENINLPQTDYGDDPDCDVNTDLIYEANKFISKIKGICQNHTSKAPKFPYVKFSAHQVLLALIVTKKRAKKAYRKINHGYVKDMCQIFNRMAPQKFRFHYINNLIVDNSSEINSNSEDCSNNIVSSALNDTTDTVQDGSESPSSQETDQSSVHFFSPKPTSSRRKQVSTPKPTCIRGQYHDHSESDIDRLHLNDSGYRTFIASPTGSNSAYNSNISKLDDCG